MHRTHAVLLVVFVTLAAGCQSGGESSPYEPSGYVQPTVSGRTAAEFCSLQEGRTAFTRCCESITAALEDASWLRFEGDPECVEAEHRAYFEYGYTTFQVELRSKAFLQPTRETFVLEDSLGRRVSGSPLTYEGSPVTVDDCYYSSFQLSFRHMITKDVKWIRLTRTVDCASVEWTFDPCAEPPPCPEPRPPACPPSCPPPCPR